MNRDDATARRKRNADQQANGTMILKNNYLFSPNVANPLRRRAVAVNSIQ